MKGFITALVVFGALSAMPLAAAAPQQKAQPAAKTMTSSKAATHTAEGVIKSVDADALVITQSGKNAGVMTFVLNSTTERQGALAVGAPVSVRYHEDGTAHVATAVHAKKAAKTGAKH